MWIIKNYFKRIGVNVISRITGDSTSDEIKNAPTASLNIVQCAGSMHYLANKMEEKFGVPYINVSFLGLEDIKASLTNIAEFTKDKEVIQKTKDLIFVEKKKLKTY